MRRGAGCRRCLRGLSAAEILLHQPGHQIAQTVIDNDFLPDWPATLLESGNFNRLNLISGTTRDEGDFFVALPEVETGVVLDAAVYPAALKAQFGPEIAPRVAEEYPLPGYHNRSKALSATLTDYLFACPSIRLMDLASVHTEVRGYEFADRTTPSYAPPVSFDMDAAHTFEILCLFPGYHGGAAGLSTELNPLQEELAEDIRGWFTGMSNSAEWGGWPRYDTVGPGVLQMQLGGSRMLGPGEYAELHHCAFWDQQGGY